TADELNRAREYLKGGLVLGTEDTRGVVSWLGRQQALMAIHAAVAEGKFLTGLIYYNPDRAEFVEGMNLCETPLAELEQDVLQPSQEQLDEINARLMR
ncbi:MAG: hypothetical protein IH919_05625, partial [Deltaproteobacteria bacterium]|nr:hypothetical protein [Deltaproteobacteria bacterium]